MQHLAFVLPLHQHIHLLTGQVLHHFEVRVKWLHHGVDVLLAPAYRTVEPLRAACLRQRRITHPCRGVSRADGSHIKSSIPGDSYLLRTVNLAHFLALCFLFSQTTDCFSSGSNMLLAGKSKI